MIVLRAPLAMSFRSCGLGYSPVYLIILVNRMQGRGVSCG